MGTGFHGGFGNTLGKKQFSIKRKIENKLPKDKSQLNHIFRDSPGHLENTSHNRKLLTNLANDSNYFKGKDKYGNSWNIKLDKNGKQLWVQYQNGTISNGGRNDVPRSWDESTGLKKNPFKKGENKQ